MRIEVRPGVYEDLTAIQYAKSVHHTVAFEVSECAQQRAWRLERIDPEESRWWKAAQFWLRRRSWKLQRHLARNGMTWA